MFNRSISGQSVMLTILVVMCSRLHASVPHPHHKSWSLVLSWGKVGDLYLHHYRRQQFFILVCTTKMINVLTFLYTFQPFCCACVSCWVKCRQASRNACEPLVTYLAWVLLACVRTMAVRFTRRLGPLQEAWALCNMAASNVSWFQSDMRRSILFYL